MFLYARPAPSLRSPIMRVIGGLAAATLLLGTAQAAEIRVISAAAVQLPVQALAKDYEAATGNHVVFEFSTGGGVEKAVRGGAKPDLVINAAERLKSLGAAGLVSPAAIRSLGSVRMGVAVRKGAPMPDLRSAEGFRASLLAASSVSYADPARGATSGAHFAKVLERLGVQDAMRGKSRMVADGLDVMKQVAAGEAELGVTQISEIVHGGPDLLAGPLPDALQLVSTYSIAPTDSNPKAAVAGFIELLSSPAGHARFRDSGFE
jgi:molybdate transport system substrate-binding protein